MKNLTLGAVLLLILQTTGFAQYTMTVESSPAVTRRGTTYRFYVDMQDATDRMSAVYGNDDATLLVNAPGGVFNSAFNSAWNASGINPAFLPVFPDLADDTYATIGLTGPASTSGIAGAADPSVVEDATQPITPFFLTPGATGFEQHLDGLFVVRVEHDNGFENLKFCDASHHCGCISGQINFQVFPLGVGADQQVSIALTALEHLVVTLVVMSKAAPMSCNYDAEATTDDGSCLMNDGTGVATVDE